MRNDLREARFPCWMQEARGKDLLCAVSGGLDSMCLLDLLVYWGEKQDCRITAAHFNHQLRGAAADRDEEFVREYCAARNIPAVYGREDVAALARKEGLSLEEAARKARYAFLRREAERLGGAHICTAHHAEDNAETILLNLLRGSGLKGLTGMERVRDGIFRPLLDVSRRELEEYAAAWNVPHLEDETNADPSAASRNFLRLRVMPLLKELNPRAVEHIGRTAGQLRAVDRSLEQEAQERLAHVAVQEGRAALPADLLFSAPEAVRPRMLLLLLDRLGAGRKDIGSVHLNAVLSMAQKKDQGNETRISLPHGVTARCCRRWLILETRPQPLTEIQLIPGQPVRWGDYTLTLLDRPDGRGIALRDRTSYENWGVRIGPCVPGDRLTLPGAKGARSVKRLCLDRRVSLAERDRLPAVYLDGRLAAVWRLGTDTAFAPEGPEAPVRFIKIEENEVGGHEKE